MPIDNQDQKIINLAFEIQILDRAMICIFSVLREMVPPDSADHLRMSREMDIISAQLYRLNTIIRERSRDGKAT